MTETVTTIVVAALAGGGVGAVASLLAPWAAWGVEKRRETREHRRALVKSWREGLAEDTGNALMEDWLDRDWFMSLRPYLNSNELERFEGHPNSYVIAPFKRRNPYVATLLTAIARQEKEWGLD